MTPEVVSMFSRTDLPSASFSSSRASTSFGFTAAACATMLAARVWKSSFLATKSVSQDSWIIAPSAAAIRPLVASRAPSLLTFAPALMRSASTALSKSPSASVRAFLLSIMPAPVRSRSFFTSAALMVAIARFLVSSVVRAHAGPRRPAFSRRRGPRARWSGGRRLCRAGGRAVARRGRRLDRGTGRLATADQQVALPLGQRLVGPELAGRLRLVRLGTVAAGVGGRVGPGHQALGHRVGHHPGQQRGAADRVVVAGDLVVDLVRVAVGVEDRHHRDAQLAGLADGDVLLLRVDHPDGARHPGHVADAAERALQLVLLPGEDQLLLLGERRVAAGLLHDLELLEALEPLVDGREVGEHPAQPALVHVRHADPLGLLGDDLLGLLLGADEQDRAAVGHGLPDELVRPVDVGQRLLQGDDVDAVALAEDEPLHLRVPPAARGPEEWSAAGQRYQDAGAHRSGFLRRACARRALLAHRGVPRLSRRPGGRRPGVRCRGRPCSRCRETEGAATSRTCGRRTREVDPPWRAAQRVYGSGGQQRESLSTPPRFIHRPDIPPAHDRLLHPTVAPCDYTPPSPAAARGRTGPSPLARCGTGAGSLGRGGTARCPAVTPGGTGPSPLAPCTGPSPLAPGGTGPCPLAPGGTGPSPLAAGGTGPCPLGPGGTGRCPLGPGGTGPSPLAPGGTGPSPLAPGGTGSSPLAPGGTGPSRPARGGTARSPASARGRTGPSPLAPGGTRRSPLARGGAARSRAAALGGTASSSASPWQWPPPPLPHPRRQPNERQPAPPDHRRVRRPARRLARCRPPGVGCGAGRWRGGRR